MDCSNDWDLQALVRSCGGGNRSVQHSRAGADAPPREEAAMVRGGGRAAAQLELLGQPVGAVSSWRRGLDHLDDLVDREPRRMPFSVSVTPSSSRETTATCGLIARAGQQLRHDDDVLFSFSAAAAAGVVSRSGHQMVQPRRRQPGRKAGGRTPRPKRRYGRCIRRRRLSVSIIRNYIHPAIDR